MWKSQALNTDTIPGISSLADFFFVKQQYHNKILQAEYYLLSITLYDVVAEDAQEIGLGGFT